MRGLVMQFFIMRHGEAQHQGLSDAERELTEYGASEVLDISQLINDVAFDLIIVSPMCALSKQPILLFKH